MSTAWSEPQRDPLSWEQYLDLDEDVRRQLEIVDGYVVPREQRDRAHQKVGFRVSAALEQAAVAQMRSTGSAECYETNTEVEVLLWEVPLTVRIPDVVLHRCLEPGQFLAAADVVVAVEVLSKWSTRRDRIHKMGDYADAGIPHYWIVQLDKLGAVSIERYMLVDAGKPYTHVGTTSRDMGDRAVTATTPFPMEVLWSQLELAPKV